MRLSRILQIAALCFALAAPLAIGPARAQPVDPRSAVQSGEALPLAQVLQRTKPLFPGRLLKVDLERARNGKLVYKLRILNESGQLMIVTTDARTANVIDVRGGG